MSDVTTVLVVTAVSTKNSSEGRRVFVGDTGAFEHPLRGRLFSENNRILLLNFMDKARAEHLKLKINPHTLTVRSLNITLGDVDLDDPEWYAAVNHTAMAKLNPVEIEALRLTGRAVQQRILDRTEDAPPQPEPKDVLKEIAFTDADDESDTAIIRRSRQPTTNFGDLFDLGKEEGFRDAARTRGWSLRNVSRMSLVRWAKARGYAEPVKVDDALMGEFADWWVENDATVTRDHVVRRLKSKIGRV